jgi:tetratricopeptide (TPR) repeat protein
LNRDNFLFLTLGALAGFIIGFMAFEVMQERQPQRLVHGEGGPVAEAPPAAPPANGGAPMMAQVEALRQRVAENPEDAEAVMELANMNFQIRNWSRAAELYAQYLELRPDSPGALSDLGICRRNQGDFDGAIEAFDRALALEPDHWLAQYNKLIVLGIDLGDYPAAEALIAAMEAQRPQDPDLGRLVAELERRQAAS